MYIDYFDKKMFKLKTTSYNDGKILHLDVTDADKPIRCRGCGSIKMKSLGGKTGTPGIYYDADVSPDGTWKFLYVTYHHNRGYKCQECNKKEPIKSKIPCKHQISPDLEEQIIKILILDPSARKRTWAKLIEEYTICDFKGKDGGNTTIQLLKKSSISNILKEYREEYERLIRGYALQENVIFYPFMYENQERGAIISCNKFEVAPKGRFKCTINGFCDVHSAENLYISLLGRANKDISIIQEILISPLIFPLYENIKNMPNMPELSDAIMAEGIDFELYKIQDQIVENQQKKEREATEDELRKLTGDFQDILASPGDFRSFKGKMDAQFLRAEAEWGNYYVKLKSSYDNNTYPWYKNIAISKNQELNKLIKRLKKTLDRMQRDGTDFHYISAIFLSEIVRAIPPIQYYVREMGNLKEPIGLQQSFNFVSATITMQRPVCDEFFIFRVDALKENYFVIVGFDHESYCRFDVVKGNCTGSLVRYFKKLTTWEKNETKTIYCRFDSKLVYDLRPLFPKAAILVDIEEIVHFFAGNHIRTEETQRIIAIAIYAFDPEPETVASRYPEWVIKRRPAIFEKIQLSPQKLLEMGYCSKDEIAPLFEIYSRVSSAPELLDRHFTYDTVRKKYKQIGIFQDLAKQEIPADCYMEKAQEEGLPPCIATPLELMFHRVLVTYEDVEIDLEGFLEKLNEPVDQDIMPS